MKQHFKLLIYISLFASFTGCAGIKQTINQTGRLTLEELLTQLPAQDQIQGRLISQAILEHGTSGVQQLIHWFNSEDSSLVIRSRYALNGLIYYCTGNGNESLRLTCAEPLQNSLAMGISVEKKIFLIQLLGILGADESVAHLEKFLKDDKLSSEAISALTMIGSDKAASTLLNSTDGSSAAQKISIFNALGQLRYQPASAKIVTFADNENERLRTSAIVAISRIAPPGFLNQFKLLVSDKPEFRNAFLDYLANLAQSGHAIAIEECYEIIENTGSLYQDHQRIKALNILYRRSDEKALDTAVELFQKETAEVRFAILDLFSTAGTKVAFEKWMAAAEKCDDIKRAEIASMFAKQQTGEAVVFLKKSLEIVSDDPAIDIYSSLITIIGRHSNPELKNLLRREFTEDQRVRLLPILMSVSMDSVIGPLMSDFGIMPDGSKLILLHILNSHEDRAFNPMLMPELTTGGAELKREVLKLFENTGIEKDLPELMHFQMTAESEQDRRLAGKAIKAIYDRSDRKNELNKIFRDLYLSVDATEKTKFFPFFKSLGGGEFLDIMKETVIARDKDIRDKGTRALCSWPDDSALDILLNIAAKDSDSIYRILAVRAICRLIGEEFFPEERALVVYNKLSGLNLRSEEKNLVISGLSTIKSAGAIDLLGKYLNDPDVSYEAVIALYKILKYEEKGKEAINDRTLAALAALLPETLSSAVLEMRSKESPWNIPPEGFTALFNGKDLSGWKGLVGDPLKRAAMEPDKLAEAQAESDQRMQEHWQVIDGILYFDGRGYDHICTSKDYKNFELLVDWKIEKGGDSGIYLRGVPQVQIWDPQQWSIGSGGLYNNQNNPSQPLFVADHPVGEWNTFRIRMVNDRVTVYLNDKLVTSNVVLENYWDRNREIDPSGQIELQAHNSPLYFRNIFIRELPDEDPLFSGPLFNGIDLTGWTVVGNTKESWKVEEGILYTEGGGGGWISTEREFSDFKLQLEFRLPEGGNSGVFIRAPHEGDPAYTGMEIQVLDDGAEIYKNLKPWQYTGSIYGLQAPKTRVTKPAGVWQKLEISCMGPSVNVVLNNIEIINANLINFMDQESSHPGIKRRKGFIGLQNHSTKIEYRNIVISEVE